MGGHERVGLVKWPVACFVYRPERREVYIQLRHLRFVEHGTVDAVIGSAGGGTVCDEQNMKNKV